MIDRPALDCHLLYRLKMQGYRHVPDTIIEGLTETPNDEIIDECCSDKHLEEALERRTGYR